MPGQEENVRYDSWNDSAGDNCSHYIRILSLADDFVVQAEECRYGAKSEPGRHHQRVINPCCSFIFVKAHRRKHGNDLGQHLGEEENKKHNWRSEECRYGHKRAGTNEVKRRE